MAELPNEIRCRGCGEHSLVRREPVYEGFKRVGEVVICTACGERYGPGEEIPYESGTTAASGLFGEDDRPTRPRVFSDADRPVRPHVFGEEERRHSCGWCRHFVVNPFTQRCGLLNRPTEATDVCDRFEPRAEDT